MQMSLPGHTDTPMFFRITLLMQDLPTLPFLNRTFLGASLQDWLIFLALWILFVLVFVVIRRFVLKHFSVIAKRTDTVIDDVIVSILGKTKTFFLFVLGAFAALLIRQLPLPVESVIRQIAFLVFLLQVGLWGTYAVTWWIDDYSERKMEEDKAQVTALQALGLALRFVLWSILLLVAIENFGIDITSLIAGLGIAGIAIALAVQNVLQDVLAYVSIVVDKPFVFGDFLVLGDYSGTVEHIGLKTTRLRSLSGEQLIMSNSDLLSSRIRNYKRMYERRIVFSVGLEYDTPKEKLEQVPHMLRKAVEDQENARFDRAHFKGFGDSSLDFETVYYVLKPEYALYMDVQQAINLQIYERFEAESLAFAFPTRTLHVETMPEKA
jgi:small-conductance mechanosensitive channel